MKFYGEIMVGLKNADIHLHYANNRGRGDSNVTITIVKKGTSRLTRTAQYSADSIIRRFRTSGWRGIVNISSAMIAEFGGMV